MANGQNPNTRTADWDKILLLMLRENFEQAQCAIDQFRAEGKDNILDNTAFIEGIHDGDLAQVTAVTRLYLTIYEAIINRDEKTLNAAIEKTLKHYRSQSSITTMNIWVLMLEKMAVRAGLNMDVDVAEAPRELLYLTPQHDKTFDIPQVDFPLEETVKRLLEQEATAPKPAAIPTPIAVQKPVAVQPVAPVLPTQTASADPVLAALGEMKETEQNLSLPQKKLWCLLSLARFNVVLCDCASLPHLKPLAGITAVIDACEAHLVSGEKYRVSAVTKFLRGIGKILDEGYLDDCEKVLEAEFSPSYLVNSIQDIETFIRLFDSEEIMAAHFLLSTILEDYNYDYLYDHLPESEPAPETVEIERVWKDLEFVLGNPSHEEIRARISAYKNIDLRNPAAQA